MSYAWLGVGAAFIYMLFWTPHKMSLGILRYITGGSPTTAEKIGTFIPGYNMLMAEINYFGKVYLHTYASILFIIATLLRLISVFRFPDNVILYRVTVIFFIVAFILLIISNIIFVFTVLRDTEAMSTGKTILFSLFYPFGQYFIGDFLYTVLVNRDRVAETFDNEY